MVLHFELLTVPSAAKVKHFDESPSESQEWQAVLRVGPAYESEKRLKKKKNILITSDYIYIYIYMANDDGEIAEENKD